MTGTMLNIILVDDSRADVELALDALQEYHLSNRVTVLRDGQEALDFIFRTGPYVDRGLCCEEPAVVLLDINMPKVDGIEVLRRIRADERTKMIPVVILTSVATRAQKSRSAQWQIKS